MRITLARFIYNFDIELADDSIGWIDHQPVFWMVREKKPLNVYLKPVAGR